MYTRGKMIYSLGKDRNLIMVPVRMTVNSRGPAPLRRMEYPAGEASPALKKGGSRIKFRMRLSISRRRWDPGYLKGDYTAGFRRAASALAEKR